MWNQGYLLLLMPEHPNANKAGYVREHLLVMSKKLGRPIDTKHEVVHHINGIRSDNSLSNLILMTRREHAPEHHRGVPNPRAVAAMQLKRWEGRPKQPKTCPQCRKSFMYTVHKTQVCCSKSCATAYRYAKHN